MAGGVAIPLKPKMKIVWGKRPHVDDKDPGASSSGQPRTEPAPDRGAESGKDDDVTLPDIGKLSMTEEKKGDMEVDQEGSKKSSAGTGEPKPRGTEAGKTDPSKICNYRGATFEEYRKTAPEYVYSGEGDDRRILPKNNPINMEKPLPAEAALLIPRAVATQEEAEEAERAAMEAIRGDFRLLTLVRRTGRGSTHTQ